MSKQKDSGQDQPTGTDQRQTKDMSAHMQDADDASGTETSGSESNGGSKAGGSKSKSGEHSSGRSGDSKGTNRS